MTFPRDQELPGLEAFWFRDDEVESDHREGRLRQSTLQAYVNNGQTDLEEISAHNRTEHRCRCNTPFTGMQEPSEELRRKLSRDRRAGGG